MTIEDTINKITSIIADQTGISSDSITPEVKLEEDLKVDSLDFVEIMLTCEDEFGIDISHDDLQKILTVQQLADYAHAHSTNP